MSFIQIENQFVNLQEFLLYSFSSKSDTHQADSQPSATASVRACLSGVSRIVGSSLPLLAALRPIWHVELASARWALLVWERPERTYVLVGCWLESVPCVQASSFQPDWPRQSRREATQQSAFVAGSSFTLTWCLSALKVKDCVLSGTSLTG